MKPKFYNFLLLLYFLKFTSATAENCGRDWVPFGEEKCYRLVKQVATWSEAKRICEALREGDEKANLVTIKSDEEEDFIEDYLFNQKHVLENVWIGAKRSDGNRDFRWIDGSKLDYKNWEDSDPHRDESKNCVQIIGNQELTNLKDLTYSHIGRWSNTQCERHNFNILCEKTQKITFARLTEIVFELKKRYEQREKELKDTMAEMQTVEGNLKHEIEELRKNEISCQMQIDVLSKSEKSLKEKVSTLECSQKNTKVLINTLETNLRHEIDVLEKKESASQSQIKTLAESIASIQIEDQKFNHEIENLQDQINNIELSDFSAPLNYTYVQYPFDPEPSEIWNCSKNGQWTDISSQYSGLFFRVNGTNSTSWGTIQEDNAPFLDMVTHYRCSDRDGHRCSSPKDIAVPRNGEPGTVHMDHADDNVLLFFNSGGEVRPRNMAIRIWKCSIQ